MSLIRNKKVKTYLGQGELLCVARPVCLMCNKLWGGGGVVCNEHSGVRLSLQKPLLTEGHIIIPPLESTSVTCSRFSEIQPSPLKVGSRGAG